MPSWIPGSTVRIAQMTGNYDPDGLVHFKDTADWGISGTDLGANTEHHGTTFIYFGDVPRADPPASAHDFDCIGFIADLKVPPRTELAGSRQHGNVNSVFFIDGDGALCVSWVKGGEVWNHPSKISRPGLAPAGACIAVAHQASEQLDVLFIGNNGALHVAWLQESGAWQGPQQISEPNRGAPGGRLIAIKQSDHQLDVFFIGTDRRLNVAWVVGGDIWHEPVAVGAADLPYPPPGAGIAACSQGANQLDVFFIGDDGGFYVAWSVDGGHWQGPQRVGRAGERVADPGAALAAFRQTDEQVTALCVGHEGRLTAMFVVGDGVWAGPTPVVPGLRAMRPGCTVCVSKQGADQWDAFVPTSDGSVHVYWSLNGQPWDGPHPIAPPHSTADDAGITAIHQGDDQLTVLFAGTRGDLNVSWVLDGVWACPVCINPDMVGLKIVAKGRVFFPFTIKGTETDASLTWTLGTGETPTGAFSFEDRVYVFAVAGHERSVSYLTSSARPEQPGPYRLDFVFSRGPDVHRGRFLQVAPVVINPADVPGLPLDTDAGVIVFGHGSASPGTPRRQDCIRPSTGLHGVNLGYLPLRRGRGPIRDTALYFAGAASGPSWVVDEADGKSLFSTCYYWTSLSAGRVPGAGKWILLHQLASPFEIPEAHDRPIVARIADQPWEIASAVDVEVFNPNRERAWDRYMFGPGAPNSHRNGPHIGHPAFAYGAYLLNKYTQWDPVHNIVTIFFLMSTGRPYQVQLMRSSIQL